MKSHPGYRPRFMARYIFERCIESILLLIAVVLLVFFSIHLTGDPVSLMISRDASPSDRQALTAALGLDRPLPEQLMSYLIHIAQGDLGTSLN